MSDELNNASAYDEKAPVVLSARIEEIATEPRDINPAWRVAVTFVSTNGRSISARVVYSYATNILAGGCRNAADALVPAVQNLIARLVTNPEFTALLNSPASDARP